MYRKPQTLGFIASAAAFPILCLLLLSLSLGGCGSGDDSDDDNNGWINIVEPTSEKTFQAAPGQTQITISGTVFQTTVQLCELVFPNPVALPVQVCTPNSQVFVCVINVPIIMECNPSVSTENGQWEYPIELTTGENRIEVSANDAALIDSATAFLTITVPTL